jgi:hypothetical protein
MLSLRSKILFAVLGLFGAFVLIAFLSVEPASFGPEKQNFGPWLRAGGLSNPPVLFAGLLLAATVVSVVIDVRRNRN